MDKPRLLFILNRFVIGGQATDTIPLLYRLKDRYEIKILFGKKEADEIAPLFLLHQYPGLDMKELANLQRKLNPVSDILAIVSIVRFIRKFRPHIVHTHGAKSGLLGRLAAWLNNVPVVVHTFHGHVFHSYFNRFVTAGVLFTERSLAAVTTASVALSPSQKLEISDKYRVFPAQKVHVIPLGLDDIPASPAMRAGFRAKYALSDADVAIAIVGRIVPIKNHHDFLEIACRVLKQGDSNAVFFIIGDGSLSSSLYTYLDQQGMAYSTPERPVKQSKIIFTSWLPDMAVVVQGLDVVVLTSLNEGTPVSLIEAQLCAKPVVAYNVGGVKDTFADKESGFLVEKGNITDFVEKLRLLLNDKQLRITMGEQGKLYCSRKFSKQTEVNATDQLYKDLLAKKELALL